MPPCSSSEPFCPPDPPTQPPGPGPAPPVFASPMYQTLHTNIPGPIMQFSDLAFPEHAPIFPPRETVQEYLVAYSQDVRHLVEFSTQVTDVRLRNDGGKDVWDLRAQSTVTGGVVARTFDAVVVASGHYSTAFIPDIANIRSSTARTPGLSRTPSFIGSPSLQGKKVIVVGNAASGIDIAWQIRRVCGRPPLLSVHAPTLPAFLELLGCEEVPAIEEFLVRDRAVRFEDGRVETEVDAVIFCTGYLFSFPFLQTLDPAPAHRRATGVRALQGPDPHCTSDAGFLRPAMRVVPFPLSESQAAILSRFWANSLSLPSTEEMTRWEAEQEQLRGPAFHVYPQGRRHRDINGTADLIAHASSGGKEPPAMG